MLRTNFFVKPYLYTDKYDRDRYLKNVIKKHMYAVEYKDLKMPFSEYMKLPLPMMKYVDEITDEIYEQKVKELKQIREKQRRSTGGINR